MLLAGMGFENALPQCRKLLIICSTALNFNIKDKQEALESLGCAKKMRSSLDCTILGGILDYVEEDDDTRKTPSKPKDLKLKGGCDARCAKKYSKFNEKLKQQRTLVKTSHSKQS